MVDLEFEWDPQKADENLKTHGVSFEEAVTVFADALARVHGDPDHSQDERREIIADIRTRSGCCW